MKLVARILALAIIAVSLFAIIDVSWEKLSPPLSPSARTQANMAADEARGEVVLFGGIASGSLSDETWVWNGAAWTLQNPIQKPPARVYHAMAYDPVRSRTVLFGGYAYVSLGDTWEWNGTDWIQLFPSVKPLPRELAAMTFDGGLGKSILFGGGIPNTYTYYDDTWTWDGTSWTLLSPSIKPSPRVMSEMAFDPIRGQTVLFGGYNQSGVCLGDTWVFDGADWAQMLPIHSPGPRGKFGMAYDGTLKRVVIFGGVNYNNGQFLSDTWAWDGQDWTQLLPGAVPPARFGNKLAYAPFASGTLLFGGYSGVYYGDTWLLKSPNAAPIARCKDITIAVGPDCTALIRARDLDDGSSDPDDDDLTFAVDYAGPFLKGESRRVTFTVSDGNGGSDSCQATVFARDLTPPVPAIEALPVLRDQCELSIMEPPTAWDACDGQIIAMTEDSLKFTQPGSYTVHWSFSDGSGNTSSQTQTVIIADTTAPTASLSGPVCVPWGMGKGSMANRIAVLTQDNCRGEVDVEIQKVEIFNAGGNPVVGRGIFEIVGRDVFVNPNSSGWKIRITVLVRDDQGNSAVVGLTKPLIKC